MPCVVTQVSFSLTFFFSDQDSFSNIVQLSIVGFFVSKGNIQWSLAQGMSAPFTHVYIRQQLLTCVISLYSFLLLYLNFSLLLVFVLLCLHSIYIVKFTIFNPF